MEIDQKKNKIINISILLIYLSIQIFLAFHHEAWRDESQAWIIARNSSYAEILGLCSSEGHPCLWFFFLKLCQLFGLSFYHISLMSTFIVTIAAGLFLWKSPFQIFTNVCILLSPIFFYYNSVICRVYALLVLLLILLCIYWPYRRQKPIAYGIIIALLFQSHILISGLAIGCLIEKLLNDRPLLNKRNMLGFMIPLISLAGMIFELYQTKGTETFIKIDINYVQCRLGLIKIINNIKSVVLKFDYSWFSIDSIILLVWLLLFIFYCLCYITNSKYRAELRNVGLVSVCGTMCYWGIIVLVRKADHIQMSIVFLMILLLLVWDSVSVKEPICSNDIKQEVSFKNLTTTIKNKVLDIRKMEGLFAICCMLMIPKSAWLDPVSDIKGPFSGSLEMAQIIEKNAPNHSVIVIHNDMFSTSIASYLYESNKQYLLWDIDNGCKYVIHKWGKPNRRKVTQKALYETICKDINVSKIVFYVNGFQKLKPDIPSIDKMTLIGKNKVPNTWNEYYQLYKVNRDCLPNIR